MDGVGDRRHRGLAGRLAGTVVRQIGPLGVGVAVHDDDVDLRRRIGVRQGGGGPPVHARDFLGIELHFLVQGTAHRVKHAAFDGAAQAFGIDDQSAVVRTDEPLDPDVARVAIHLHLGDFGEHGLAAVGVGDAAAGQHRAGADRPW